MKRKKFRSTRWVSRVERRPRPGKVLLNINSVRYRRFSGGDKVEEALFSLFGWASLGGFLSSFLVFLLEGDWPIEVWRILGFGFIGVFWGCVFGAPIVLTLFLINRKLEPHRFPKILSWVFVLFLLLAVPLGSLFWANDFFAWDPLTKLLAIAVPFSLVLSWGIYKNLPNG